MFSPGIVNAWRKLEKRYLPTLDLTSHDNIFRAMLEISKAIEFCVLTEDLFGESAETMGAKAGTITVSTVTFWWSSYDFLPVYTPTQNHQLNVVQGESDRFSWPSSKSCSTTSG